MMATRTRRSRGTVTLSVEQVQRFLASDAGVRLRRLIAGGAVITAPLLFRLPLLRRYPLLRLLETLGGAALIVKLASALRDWDPARPRPIVLEIDPPGPPTPPRRDV